MGTRLMFQLSRLFCHQWKVFGRKRCLMCAKKRACCDFRVIFSMSPTKWRRNPSFSSQEWEFFHKASVTNMLLVNFWRKFPSANTFGHIDRHFSWWSLSWRGAVLPNRGQSRIFGNFLLAHQMMWTQFPKMASCCAHFLLNILHELSRLAFFLSVQHFVQESFK